MNFVYYYEKYLLVPESSLLKQTDIQRNLASTPTLSHYSLTLLIRDHLKKLWLIFSFHLNITYYMYKCMNS